MKRIFWGLIFSFFAFLSFQVYADKVENFPYKIHKEEINGDLIVWFIQKEIINDKEITYIYKKVEFPSLRNENFNSFNQNIFDIRKSSDLGNKVGSFGFDYVDYDCYIFPNQTEALVRKIRRGYESGGIEASYLYDAFGNIKLKYDHLPYLSGIGIYVSLDSSYFVNPGVNDPYGDSTFVYIYSAITPEKIGEVEKIEGHRDLPIGNIIFSSDSSIFFMSDSTLKIISDKKGKVLWWTDKTEVEFLPEEKIIKDAKSKKILFQSKNLK